MDTLTLYRDLLRIRHVEEAIAKKYGEQKMRCPTHLSIGQEAVAVGVSAFLSNDDKVYSSHRAHAHYLAKGGCLNKLIAELYGKESGCTGGRGGSMHLSDLSAGFVASTAIVANSIPLAVGNALHQKVQRKNEISVTYFGDGATEEGAFYESANFAAVKALPVLFVCENNQFSVYSPLQVRQPKARNISELAQSIGLTSFSANGNDMDDVICVAEKAVKHIRDGQGPAFIEYHTYRHREHCGPNFDDHLAYRNTDETAHWLAKDPVALFTKKLLAAGHTEDELSQIATDIGGEISLAFNTAEQAAFPHEKNNKKFIYA